MSENHSVNVRLCGPLVSTSFLEFSTRDQIFKNVEKYVPHIAECSLSGIIRKLF